MSPLSFVDSWRLFVREVFGWKAILFRVREFVIAQKIVILAAPTVPFELVASILGGVSSFGAFLQTR
jgi:hypothetical protein